MNKPTLLDLLHNSDKQGGMPPCHGNNKGLLPLVAINSKGYATGLLLIFLFCTPLLLAQEPVRPIPAFVLGPPGRNDGQAIRELADLPDQWATVRSRVGNLVYADHVLHRQNKDDDTLTELLGKFRRMNLPLQLEVGAVKPWGKTGAEVFTAQKPMWERFLRCGALIDSIVLDEPFVCCMFSIKDDLEGVDPLVYAATETAAFIALVRKDYPNWKIGSIEGFPSLSADQLIQWIDLLEVKLKAKGVRGLDFFRIDTDWMHFVHDTKKGSWGDMKRIEDHCRRKGIPFSVIYWAANYPAMLKQDLADDRTWYVGVLQMSYAYAAVGGKPDQIVVQSWVEGPNTILPETKPFTFTHSALDLSERFLP